MYIYLYVTEMCILFVCIYIHIYIFSERESEGERESLNEIIDTYEDHETSFQTFFVWALLVIVHT